MSPASVRGLRQLRASATILAEARVTSKTDWPGILRRGITGPEAAAICGVHPSMGVLDVWLSKQAQSRGAPDVKGMELNDSLEDLVAKAFARKTGVIVRRRGVILGTASRSPSMLADVRRVTREPADGLGIMEIQIGGLDLARAWCETDGPPDWLKIWAMHDLAVTGLGYAHVAVLMPGDSGLDIHHARLERDEATIASLIEIERAFWQGNVMAGNPPVSDTQDVTKLMAAFYPQSRPLVMALPAAAEEFIEGYLRADRTIQKMTEEREHYANLLKGFLLDAEIGTLGQYEVKWKPDANGVRQFGIIRRNLRRRKR